MDKKTVLIVNDEIGSRTLLTIVFKRSFENFEICTANDGQEAVEMLETLTPDLLITDSIMPRMNGDELYEHLRQTHQFKTLPIIFVSITDSKHFVLLDRNDPQLRIFEAPIYPKVIVETARELLKV